MTDPVFLGGRYTSVELLHVIGVVSAVIQVSFVELTLLCFSRAIFFGSFVLQFMFVSSPKMSYGETKFEIFREQIGHLHFKSLRGAGCLIYYCKLCCFLSRVSYLSLSSFARVAVVFTYILKNWSLTF